MHVNHWRLLALIGLGIIAAFCSGGAVLAAPVRWHTGQTIDLSVDQVARLKTRPGIYYFDYQPDQIVKSRIDQWEIIELPASLGGGFLMGTAANLEDALVLAGNRSSAGQAAAPSAAGVSKQDPHSTGSMAAIDRQAPVVWQWWLTTGYRLDELDWTIGVPGINVLSELEWKDVEIWQINLGLDALFFDRIKIRGDFAYGYAFDGEVVDSDYNADDRTDLWSRSVSSAEDSGSTDVSIGAGYRFSLLGDRIELIPMGGYSVHYQYLRIRDGVQTVSEPGLAPTGITPAPIGPLDSDLDSTYDARWQGFWIGLTSNFTVFSSKTERRLHEFSLNAEYHDADYSADANWNLRDLKFEHEADGYGLVFNGGYRFFFTPAWSLYLTGSYQKWETDEGTDRVFFSDGSSATTTLNEVNWESMAVMIGVKCRF